MFWRFVINYRSDAKATCIVYRIIAKKPTMSQKRKALLISRFPNSVQYLYYIYLIPYYGYLMRNSFCEIVIMANVIQSWLFIYNRVLNHISCVRVNPIVRIGRSQRGGGTGGGGGPAAMAMLRTTLLKFVRSRPGKSYSY